MTCLQTDVAIVCIKSIVKNNRNENVVLLPSKCSPFGVQKDSFYKPKGLHLEGKRITFEKQVKSFIIKTTLFGKTFTIFVPL